MADRAVDVLLIGGGPASASCAQELRAQGFAGSVLLCGRELDPPYERPPISKGLLTGGSAREEAFFAVPEDVEVLTRTSVMKLDTAERTATLSTKETVRFEHALVATGANVRRLPIDGSDLDGIHYLRALRNADALRADVDGAERVVLIGGSFIACEVAASLTTMGIACTMLFPEDEPMERALGTAVGGAVRRLLEERGVEVVSGEACVRLEGDGERVGRAVTESGRAFDCQAVVIGVGAVPDVMLAKAAGLELGASGGVRCSSRLETSAAGVYAAGDMCEFDSVLHGGHVRIEHHEVAVGQGRCVARNIAGRDEAYEDVPYFWSDLADWATVESVGAPPPGWDEDVIRGSLDKMRFTAFHLRDGRVVGATTAGRPDDLEEAEILIRTGAEIGADELRSGPAPA